MQTHRGGIHLRGQVPDMDRKHCSYKKENGQLCICMDFQNLNDASPKDVFSLPITKLMINSTTVIDSTT